VQGVPSTRRLRGSRDCPQMENPTERPYEIDHISRRGQSLCWDLDGNIAEAADKARAERRYAGWDAALTDSAVEC
jgi:hypothetical protein